MGEYESDSYIAFTPKVRDESPGKRQELSNRIQTALDKIPGVSYEFTQPMEMRMDETITGTRGDVALKIFAPGKRRRSRHAWNSSGIAPTPSFLG